VNAVWAILVRKEELIMRKVWILLLVLLMPVMSYAEPRVDDQGDTPMCGVYAVCNAVEEQMILDGIPTPEGGFSKDWLWEKCSEIDDSSDGLDPATPLIVATTQGLCPAESYGAINADEIASRYKIATYSAIEYDEDTLKYLLTNDHVVIIATELTRNDWADGVIQNEPEETTEGHMTYLYSFNEIDEINGARGYYIGINSWGEEWGFNGSYYMKYNFLSSRNFGIFTIKIEGR
jgi:hypothetical protein